MRFWFSWLSGVLGRCGCGLLLWLLAAPAAFGQGWLPEFHPPGLNGRVVAVVAQSNGDLIAGGDFTNADGHPTADYVARWDGRSWQPLGAGPGRFTHLTALRALPQDHLLAAGVTLDSATVRSVVTHWDGQRWQQLGSILPGLWVTTLAVRPNGELLAGFSGGRAAGRGYQTGVMRWRGGRWQPLAPAPGRADNQEDPHAADGRISQLLATPAGDLLAVGIFPGGPYLTNAAARWTGTAWQLLDPPAQGYRSAETLALTASGEVLAGGILADAQNNTTNYVARWTGHAWQPLGTGPAGKVERLVLAPSGEVLATTSLNLTKYYVTRFPTIERWDGRAWQPFGSVLPTARQAQEVLAATADGTLIGLGATGLARWDGHAWHALASPPSAGFALASTAQVSALAAAKGQLFLAGTFYGDAPDQPGVQQFRTQVYRWDGQQRHMLGVDFRGTIEALAVAPTGEVLAAGRFALPGLADSIHHVARWDGSHWQPLGAGPPGAVLALAVAPGGDVLVGGAFGLYRWNGYRWQAQPLPPSPESSGSPTAPALVSALAVAPNGDVLAGGRFAGSNPYNDVSVLRWDGQRWHPLEGSVEPFVHALAVAANGDVVVGTGGTSVLPGYESDAGTVMRTDTASAADWEYPPPHFDGCVQAVAIAANGDLLAGGSFSRADGTFTGFIARRHKGIWRPLASGGLNGAVQALLVAPNGDIVVGGEFTATGDGTQSLGLWGIYRGQ